MITLDKDGVVSLLTIESALVDPDSKKKTLELDKCIVDVHDDLTIMLAGCSGLRVINCTEKMIESSSPIEVMGVTVPNMDQLVKNISKKIKQPNGILIIGNDLCEKYSNLRPGAHRIKGKIKKYCSNLVFSPYYGWIIQITEINKNYKWYAKHMESVEYL